MNITGRLNFVRMCWHVRGCGVVVVRLKATDVDNSVEMLAFALCQCR